MQLSQLGSSPGIRGSFLGSPYFAPPSFYGRRAAARLGELISPSQPSGSFAGGLSRESSPSYFAFLLVGVSFVECAFAYAMRALESRLCPASSYHFATQVAAAFGSRLASAASSAFARTAAASIFSAISDFVPSSLSAMLDLLYIRLSTQLICWALPCSPVHPCSPFSRVALLFSSVEQLAELARTRSCRFCFCPGSLSTPECLLPYYQVALMSAPGAGGGLPVTSNGGLGVLSPFLLAGLRMRVVYLVCFSPSRIWIPAYRVPGRL